MVKNSITGVAQPSYGLEPVLEFSLSLVFLARQQFIDKQSRLPDRPPPWTGTAVFSIAEESAQYSL